MLLTIWLTGNGSVQSCILGISGYSGTRIQKDFIGLLRGVKTQKRFTFPSNYGQPHPISFQLSHVQRHMSMSPMHENSKRFYRFIKKSEKKGKQKKGFRFDQIMGSHLIPFHYICPTYKGISMKSSHTIHKHRMGRRRSPQYIHTCRNGQDICPSHMSHIQWHMNQKLWLRINSSQM